MNAVYSTEALFSRDLFRDADEMYAAVKMKARTDWVGLPEAEVERRLFDDGAEVLRRLLSRGLSCFNHVRLRVDGCRVSADYSPKNASIWSALPATTPARPESSGGAPASISSTCCSLRLRESNCCGMRSKVHDPFQAFGTEKLDLAHPTTKAWPADWKTPGDELYQTIEFLPGSHPLLKVKSPKDGREHIVCWTSNYGKGRVFATTLGHDMKTSADADYLRLLANGLLWACDKLDKNGKPKPGFAGTSLKAL